MMNSSFFEKAWFVLSLTIVVLLYGFAANKQGWFPSPILERAWQQAEAWYASQLPAAGFRIPRVYRRTGVRVVKPEKCSRD